MLLRSQNSAGKWVLDPVLKRLGAMKGIEKISELDEAKLKLTLMGKPKVGRVLLEASERGRSLRAARMRALVDKKESEVSQLLILSSL